MTKDKLSQLYWLLDELQTELPEDGFEKEWADIAEVKGYVDGLENQ